MDAVQTIFYLNNNKLLIMKVLIVCSETNGRIAPFITDQVDALINVGIEVAFFTISKPGIIGYLSALNPLKIKLKRMNQI